MRPVGPGAISYLSLKQKTQNSRNIPPLGLHKVPLEKIPILIGRNSLSLKKAHLTVVIIYGPLDLVVYFSLFHLIEKQ